MYITINGKNTKNTVLLLFRGAKKGKVNKKSQNSVNLFAYMNKKLYLCSKNHKIV